MSKRQRGRGKGPGAPGGAPQQQRPAQGGGERPAQQQSGWTAVRDGVRRDIEQATQALSFAERLSERLDGQRRLFIDFPRVTEELRSGSLERIAVSLSHLYEGGQGVLDLARFLRDLPLALAHLAAAEAQARRGAQAQQQSSARAAAAAGAPAAEGDTAHAEAAHAEGEHTDAAPEGDAHAETPEAAPDAAPEADASAAAAATAPPATESVAAAPGNPAAAATESVAAAPGAPAPAPEAAAAAAPAVPAAPVEAGPVNPRLELRAKLLAAAPQLLRAAQTYRRNVATVRRATAPRRSPGPWRSDKEVLDQARRAVEFARQIYDAYAEAWVDGPLQKNAFEAAADETDRFLAWTQLTRYVELARVQPSAPPAAAGAESPSQPSEQPAQPSQPPPVADAAPDASEAGQGAAP